MASVEKYVRFDRDMTNIVKGFAILFMVKLHSYAGDFVYEVPLNYDHAFMFAHDGFNICVGLFTFMIGYGYAFSFNKSCHITSLDIVPAGSTAAAYQVKYSDVKKTDAGNIAHGIDVNATIDKKKMAFSLDYKNIEWNGNVKIDRNIPSGYSRMSAKDLFSMFAK